MPTATGTVSKTNSDPRGFTANGVPFTPVSADQYALALAAWTKGAEVKVTYTLDPMTVTNVESPP